MKGLTPQGRNCCRFFFLFSAALFRIPTSILLHPPPPLSLSLWLCPHALQAPCQSLFTELVLAESQWHGSFPPSCLLSCTLLCLPYLVTSCIFIYYILFPPSFLFSFFLYLSPHDFPFLICLFPHPFFFTVLLPCLSSFLSSFPTSFPLHSVFTLLPFLRLF